jgi:hypothetical protein
VAAWGWGRESRDVVLGREIFLLGAAGIGLFRFSFLFIYFLNNSNLLNCSLFYPRHVSREPQFGKIFRTCSSSQKNLSKKLPFKFLKNKHIYKNKDEVRKMKNYFWLSL